MLSLTSNQTDFNPHSLTCAVLSCVWFFVALWTAAHQVPLSVELSKQQYLRWLPFPTPGDLPDPGIEPASPGLPGRFFTTASPGKLYCTSHQDEKMFLKGYSSKQDTQKSICW